MLKFAFVFPGQGSQTVGMLSSLAIKYSIVESVFSEASNVLGYDLWLLTQKGPYQELNKTYKTQPILLAASIAIYKIWKSKYGSNPSILAGHSLGEYSALVCAGVLDFVDAIKLVELRGKLMQEAVPEGQGAMRAIIGLDAVSVQEACKESMQNQLVSLVNFNSPSQMIIAGHYAAVERASIKCKTLGAKSILSLPISVPAHCELMKNAAQKLSIVLENITFNKPTIPIINNVDVKYEHQVSAIRDALVRQLYSPVRWKESIEYMVTQEGITHFFEIGPGKVLTGLTKHIVHNITSLAINDPASLSAALSIVHQ